MKYPTRSIIITTMLFGLFGCNDKKDDYVFDRFKTLIEQQGLKIDSVDNTGLIYINKGELTLRVSLDNLRRDYERDKDESYIEEFVTVTSSQLMPLPDWSEAKENIFLSVFPSDAEFHDFIHKPLTDGITRIFIHNSDSKLSWISTEDLKTWNISEEELEEIAIKNTSSALEQAHLTYDTIEDRKLGFLETEHETIKAALLFASNLKEKVYKEFGWPVYAVLPVRDFCFIFSEKDLDFFSERLGQMVVQEYKESGYPLSTAIIKFSDTGAKEIGVYPVE